MKRTDYLDVTRELAHALGMNYVFGVEFVEVDPLDDLGVEKVQLDDPALAKQMQEDLKPDPARYLGLHGNAILSRYPIQNAQIFRLPVCHDWYETEKLAISKLEQGKRFAADKIFLARIEQRSARRRPHGSDRRPRDSRFANACGHSGERASGEQMPAGMPDEANGRAAHSTEASLNIQ